MKTIIPKDPTQMGLLSDNVIAKHTADGASSIITSLVKDEVKVAIANLKELTKRTEELRRQSEAATEQRDLEAKKVEQFLRSVRDVINANYPDQPKKLTDYGFQVDDTPSKPSPTQK